MNGLTGSIITLVTAGVLSAFGEALCEKVNKPEYSQFVRLTGFSVAGVAVITTVSQFIKTLKQI